MATKKTEKGKNEQSDGASSIAENSQTSIKKMISVARERGYITYDELNEVLPPDQVSSEQIEDVMSMLSEMGINIIEADDVEDDSARDLAVVETDKKELALANTGEAKLDRTDDPCACICVKWVPWNCYHARAKLRLPSVSRQAATP